VTKTQLPMLALAILVVAASLAVASPASAVSTGTISGTLTDLGGTYTVSATGIIDAVNVTHAIAPVETVADSAGKYTFSLPPGSYRIFAHQSLRGDACDEIWNGGTPYESQSPIIVVTAGSTATADVDFPAGGLVYGEINYSTGPVLSGGVATAYIEDDAVGELRFMESKWASPDGSYRLGPMPAGKYVIRFSDQRTNGLTTTQYWFNHDDLAGAQVVTVTVGSPVESVNEFFEPYVRRVSRIGGADRFEVAAHVAASYPSGLDEVFVVDGLNYPDALSASASAAALAAPILLVSPDSIPDATATALSSLNPKHIVVVGGPTSVSPAVFDQLNQDALNGATRIGGADRYEASRNLAEYVFGASGLSGQGGANTVYVATGTNFPDALAAGPAAADENGPLLLVDGSANGIDVATRQLIEDLGASDIVIAGGPASVDAQVASDLAAIPGVVEVPRPAGADRYQSAVNVGKQAFDLADTVYLTTGSKFPDALAGGALAGTLGAPVLLVQHDCIPRSAFQQMLFLRPHDVVILGGTASVGTGVENLDECSS